MEATIVIAKPRRRMYAAQSEDGQYVIFQLLDPSEPEMGDIISNPEFDVGMGRYKNVTNGILTGSLSLIFHHPLFFLSLQPSPYFFSHLE